MTLDFDTSGLADSFASIARGLRETTLVSLPLPRPMLEDLRARPRPELLRRSTVAWRSAGKKSTLLGFGREVTAGGPRISAFASADAHLQRWRTAPRILEASPEVAPAFFGGGRFGEGGSHDAAWDAFGGWMFILPTVLLSAREDELTGGVTMLLDPGTSVGEIAKRLRHVCDGAAHGSSEGCIRETSEHEWCEALTIALGDIAAGSYEKVALARTSLIRRPDGIDEGNVLARLLSRYENCYGFKFAAGGRAWTGATPELLCRVRHGVVETVALAGSIGRGQDAAGDDNLAARILADPKERHEHAVVVEALEQGLAPFCTSLEAPREPEVVRLPNIQHLRTPMRGALRCNQSALTVAAALHPTPAVGGWPRADALAAITRIEGMDRGWYAGPIGRVDLDGEGEFAVGLRAALIGGAQARLYAGAGIVDGSNPMREWLETETKFRPLREAIGGC